MILLLFLIGLKKMSKIVVEEFDVYHRFMSDIVEFILPIEQRFVLFEHNVSSEYFMIFVGCNKALFEHKINEFVRDNSKKAKKNELYRSWAVDRPLVEVENLPYEYFPYSIVISFIVN